MFWGLLIKILVKLYILSLFTFTDSFNTIDFLFLVLQGDDLERKSFDFIE